MSLRPMNCDTPTMGGTSEVLSGMCWGVYGTDISTLPNLNRVPIGNTEDGIPITVNSYGDLPSDVFNGIQCAHDTNVYYQSTSDCIPSPYLTDGSRNPGYYQTTSPSSTSNAMSDFDGRGNTDKILTVRGTKDYSSWKPTYNNEADYPAASCCDMFYTDGTQQGDWYLPALGELSYIMPNFSKINEAIEDMSNLYSTMGVKLNTSGLYWSSSEYSYRHAYDVHTGTGTVYYDSKAYTYNAHAWSRFK